MSRTIAGEDKAISRQRRPNGTDSLLIRGSLKLIELVLTLYRVAAASVARRIYPKSANGSGYIVTWTLQGAATAQTRPRVTSSRTAAHEQVKLPGEATRIATPREPLVRGHPAAQKVTIPR